ncbi:MAG: chaperone modulator CbpM [Deltaproteobacteria bacterium]|jgi:DNA-binding transcriptional MerR regulator|nr:chaperone modulator CbpM [Deltaproteobacteria bacterium]
MARRETESLAAVRVSASVFFCRSALLRLGKISERKLELWEREELIVPARVAEFDGRPEPLYDRRAIARIRIIRTLERELGVNLPGIAVVLRLLDRFAAPAAPRSRRRPRPAR